MPTDRVQRVSYVLAAAALLFVLHFHLLAALLAGMLVYELVHRGALLLDGRLSGQRAKLLVVAILAIAIGGAVVAAVVGIAAFLRDENSLAALAAKMAEILEKSRIPPRRPHWPPRSPNGAAGSPTRSAGSSSRRSASRH